MILRKSYFRIAIIAVALAVASLAAVSAYDRDALKAAPLVGQLPWRVVLGNTALQAEHRAVDSFLPEVTTAIEQQPKMLFLGDSLSRYWKVDGKQAWQQHFADRQALSLGVSGDRIQHLLYRLRSGALDSLQPETIVLQIGTNNVNRNTPDEISAAIQVLVSEINAKWPAARVLVVGIPPRELPRSRDVLDRIERTNQLLAASLSNQQNITFIDLGDRFLASDGWLNPELFMAEGVHLSPTGYHLLAQRIASALE